MMYYFGNRMMGGRGLGMGLGIIVCLVVIALVVLAIIALVRYIRSTTRAHYTTAHVGAASNGNPASGAAQPQYGAPVVDTALQILNERYARGEISDDEYRAKKAEILR